MITWRYQWALRLGMRRWVGVVHVDQAPALGVALGPLEVVQQRPDVVALQRHAGGDRAVRGGEVVAQEGDPGGVVDGAVGARGRPGRAGRSR